MFKGGDTEGVKMNQKQVIFSIILTIVSLLIGYFLSYYASAKANEMLLKDLKEESDIIDKNYDELINNPNLDVYTRKYIEARHEYLKNKITTIKDLVQTL